MPGCCAWAFPNSRSRLQSRFRGHQKSRVLPDSECQFSEVTKCVGYTGPSGAAGKPTGSLIRSTWVAGGGASIKAGKAVTLGADYDWQESTFAGNPANSDVTAWASARLNGKMNLSIFGSTGLNNNSGDFAGGIGLSIKLN